MHVLVTGWPSFLHGEATAGDVLSMRRVVAALTEAGIACDVAWSPGFRPGELHLDDADPGRYSHLVFACGPAHGEQVRGLHERFPACTRIAVGVSVIDEHDPAVTGFHRVLARDGAGQQRQDLAASAETSRVPVVAVILAPGQHEYGTRRRHEQVHKTLQEWLVRQDCARVPLDTRLDTSDWRHCATGDQFVSALARFDVVVTTRLHGLVLAVRTGVPALAVDPIAGGGKVTAQARALGWPALLPAEDLGDEALGHWWRWCLSEHARAHATAAHDPGSSLVDALLDEVRA
ncbi:polysaccharide pyruvyl transferase family protein [Prauserella oleivorans]|uniref:Polysaccharide pyruvyl transferase family protein n=1 Tax=Prauserella oleivorans TaxID=1478153 RepID=A0ABW5W8F8_9PSEU